MVSDKDHVTIELSGGGPKKRVHVCLDGWGSVAETQYDNMTLAGESVFVQRGKKFELDGTLSIGTYSTAGSSATNSYANAITATSSYSEQTFDSASGQWR